MLTSIGEGRIVLEIGGLLYNKRFLIRNQVSACGMTVGEFTVKILIVRTGIQGMKLSRL